jgi:hypothetical protein
MEQKNARRLARAGFALALAAALAACGGGGTAQAPQVTPPTPEYPGLPAPGTDTPTPAVEATIRLAVLSSPADRVAGNEALVELELLKFDPAQRLAVISNGSDVTALFQEDPLTGRLLANVKNIRLGANELQASYGGYTTKLALTGYPITGPVISGPHEEPFICGYQSFTRLGGAQFTPVNDGKCSVETMVSYFYRNTSGGNTAFNHRSPPAAYPANMSYVTVNGKTVPYLVRLESGTVNRAVYQSAILHDVLKEPVPTPTTRPAGWNGKLYYPLGGGCQGGWYQQGNAFDTLINNDYMLKGYAVTTSTLNVFGTNCNDLLSSETVAMVKERFIKSYGVPIYTVGIGGSGGAYQSNQTSDNYPGLFDGVITHSTFPDVTSTTLMKLFDSRLLNNFFTANAGWTDAQKAAISGYINVGNIAEMSTQAGRMDPVVSFPAGMATGDKYHPVTNRRGARATVYDHTKNVYGVNAEGHALRPMDNVGVQYGLKALNSGAITVDQFLTLNDRIGGLDGDLLPQARRTEADLPALERAYQSGRIVNGGGGLAATAIIDRREYNDARVDIHAKIHSYSVRERLRKANGHADNHVILSAAGVVAAPAVIDAMDRWLMAALADTTAGRTRAQKIAANRPSDLVDACWDAGGTKIEEPQTAFGASQCNTLYPAATTPRMVAGGPLSDDVVKCQLKPLDRADYVPAFNATQWLFLQQIFPQGVCDYGKPGVGQQPLRGTWLSFGPLPANLLFDITRP